MAPENSLEALVLATGIPGCDGVEFDVRLSRDRVPVLLHDTTLARVQGRSEAVDELSAGELRPLGIPSLVEVLDAVPPEAFLDVELKGDDHARPTAGVLRDRLGDDPENAVISSFSAATLAAMADRLPGWPRWLNAGDLGAGTVALALELGCRAVSVSWGAISPGALRRAREAGLDVAAWTVRRPATFERLGRLGVIAVCVEGAALDDGQRGSGTVPGARPRAVP
jgi:glycerophosphoryl diester phosphodiesterase